MNAVLRFARRGTNLTQYFASSGEETILRKRALALYRESRGEQPKIPPSQRKTKSNVAPDVTGLDLASVEPVLIAYTVTDADLQSVGPLPSKMAEQAKLKFLSYHDAADTIAEKFHSDVHFLEQLNPNKMKTIKPGDQIKVPNVEPFDLASVKSIKPGSEVSSQAANEMEDQPGTQTPNPGESAGAPGNVAINIDTKNEHSRSARRREARRGLSGHRRLRTYRLAYRRMERCAGSPRCPRFAGTRKCSSTASAAAIFTCSDPAREIPPA